MIYTNRTNKGSMILYLRTILKKLLIIKALKGWFLVNFNTANVLMKINSGYADIIGKIYN